MARRAGVSDEIRDAMIRHQVFLERYKSSLVKKFGSLNEEVTSRILNILNKLPDNPSRAEVEKVLRNVVGINKEMVKDLSLGLSSELGDFAEYELDYNKGIIENNIPSTFNVNLGIPSSQTLYRIVNTEPFNGYVLDKWAKTIGAANAERSRRQLYIGLAEGEPIPKIVNRFKFIEGQSKRDLETVVRTSVSNVSNKVKSNLYKANSDVIKGEQWVSALDGRTSPICRARDGKVYPLGEAPPIPAHPRCRSTVVPVIKSHEELGIPAKDLPPETRASMNGQVPSSTTYNSWLRQQPKGFVEEVLGKKRADLFLNDKMTLDKFVDQQGKLITLDKLKESNK